MSDDRGQRVIRMERPLLCLVCGHDRFHTSTVYHRSRAGIFRPGAQNVVHVKHVCARCRYVHMFEP